MARYRQLYSYVLIVVALAATQLLDSAYVTNLLIVIALHSMAAIGLSLLMGYAGQVSLGHAAFYGLGAYGSALLSMHLGLNPWFSLIIAATLVGLVGWAVGWLVFRLRGHHLVMATLGFGVIVYVCLVELHQWTGGPNGLPGIPALRFFGREFYSDRQVFPIVWAVCLVLIYLTERLVRSPIGLAIKAIGENELVAASLGNSPNHYKRLILLVSAVYAAVGGALYAHYIGYLSPGPFDIGFSVKLLVMVAIGGFAHIWGVVFGVAFVTLVSEVVKPFGAYDIVLFGALLVWTMIYCPQGLLEKGRELLLSATGRATRKVAG